jgi:2,3-bisphosphoglycerate-independent phosphoglycerate mutase
MELRRHPSFGGVRGPVLTIVMDGVGVGPRDDGDAVYLARTPTLDHLFASSPTTTLRAHGTAVGLPSDADMGNSEVGHNALGAGRVFDQGAKRVALAIESGEIFGDEWRRLVETVRESGEPLHFIGLLSDGNVHSHIEHLFAMLRRAKSDGVGKARVHVLLDGRDVGATTALAYIDTLEKVLGELGPEYLIASGGGRMKVTMDRYEADWAMVELGWNLHVRGRGRGFASAREAIETFRAENPGIGDQFLPGFVIEKHGRAVGPIRDGAAVVFFNFRGDRAIELTRAFEDETFTPFDREPRPKVAYAGMMQYDGDLLLPKHFLVRPPAIDRTLGEYLARNGVTQLACSETQKFGHVTYFWNGNRSGKFDARLETYVEVPSDRVPFEERPWMKAAEIADVMVARLADFRHARINFANGDMVGHTGHLEATILAVEAVDLSLARILPVVAKLGGAVIVTADHGNADDMLMRDKRGEPERDEIGRLRPKTSHTLNPVPCAIFAPGYDIALAGIEGAGLANVAATTLHLLGYDRPEGYEPSLLR